MNNKVKKALQGIEVSVTVNDVFKTQSTQLLVEVMEELEFDEVMPLLFNGEVTVYDETDEGYVSITYKIK